MYLRFLEEGSDQARKAAHIAVAAVLFVIFALPIVAVGAAVVG
jgi:hypothetical protein